MPLAHPLTEQQIRAAEALHGRLTGWQDIDTALAKLAEQFPDFDGPSTLLKATAINALYGTNVYAIYRMAKHVERVLSEASPEIETWGLVERMAALPGIDEKQPRQCLSFASKFAHFFLGREEYAIKDSYAERMLRFHLGRENTQVDRQHPYRAYLSNYHRLKELSHLELTNRELDRYLWLAGQYRTWSQNPETRLGRDIVALFENPTSEVSAELEVLLPSVLAENCAAQRA